MSSPRIAIVTGGARGLGFAMCQRLAQDGLHCIAFDRSGDVAMAAAALPSPLGQAEGVQLDVTDGPAVAAAVARVREHHGRVDVLVNNAGIHPKHPDGRFFAFSEIARADWERVMDVNLSAVFELCRAVLPVMQAGGWGRVVNISSRTARTYSASAGAHYAASKAAVIALTRVIAGEYGPSGITANCIAPGPTMSPMAAESGERTKRFATTVPVRRIGTPEELAATVAFLASDSAGYINGAVLDFNGGSFMP